MKNLKCVIGATILTPLAIILLVAIIFGLCWLLSLLSLYTWMPMALVALAVGCAILSIWYVIFEHCVRKHQKKEM